MTPRQIELVQETFAAVRGDPDGAARLFYATLFALDPSLRALFAGDMTRQRALLMKMIATAVDGLDRIGELVPAIEDLGARHVAYGVRDEHYDVVGAALLSTLANALGDGLSDEARDAWAAVYGVLAGTMKAGAARVAGPDSAAA